jgi:hypothetical protein
MDFMEMIEDAFTPFHLIAQEETAPLFTNGRFQGRQTTSSNSITVLGEQTLGGTLLCSVYHF